MFNKIINWFLMSKAKNAAGELGKNGISVTKLSAVLIGLLQATEFISPYFGHPVVIDPKIYGIIASIGGIALRESINKSS